MWRQGEAGVPREVQGGEAAGSHLARHRRALEVSSEAEARVGDVDADSALPEPLWEPLLEELGNKLWS